MRESQRATTLLGCTVPVLRLADLQTTFDLSETVSYYSPGFANVGTFLEAGYCCRIFPYSFSGVIRQNAFGDTLHGPMPICALRLGKSLKEIIMPRSSTTSNRRGSIAGLRSAMFAICLSLTGLVSFAQTNAEGEVQTAVDALWDAASNRDTENSFGVSVPNDDGFYVLDGQVIWTRQATLEMYDELFAAASRNDIEMTEERITMLADDLALYVGVGTYDMADMSGASLGGGDMALTLLLRKTDERWQLLHLHQSFPAAE